jgi:hypothetical protein
VSLFPEEEQKSLVRFQKTLNFLAYLWSRMKINTGLNIRSLCDASDLNLTVRKGYSDHFCRGEMGKNWLSEGL